MQINQKAAESLADPEEYPNMFDDWQVALEVESKVAETRCDMFPLSLAFPFPLLLSAFEYFELFNVLEEFCFTLRLLKQSLVVFLSTLFFLLANQVTFNPSGTTVGLAILLLVNT